MKRRELGLTGGACRGGPRRTPLGTRASDIAPPPPSLRYGPRTAAQPEPEPLHGGLPAWRRLLSQPLASMAGVDTLKAGGNAIDAAIATNAMLSLTEPMMCGPGGDLFAIIWNEKDQKLSALNASGRSPYDWTLEKPVPWGSSRFHRRARCRGACPAASAAGTRS